MESSKEQPSDTFGLSSREVRVALIAWQCLDGDGKIQLNKFARLTQYASTESARTNWSRIKSKLKAAGEANDAGANDDDGQDINKTVDGSKKKKAAPRKRKAADVEGAEEQNDEADGTAASKVAKKRRPRQAKTTKLAKAEEEGEKE